LSKLAERLFDWYAHNARKLIWRGHRDPYAIWISEIMLQQTRVETVIPYFEKWMILFPNVSDLAGATESDVLSAWEGLGYYSRARSLRLSAQKIMEEHNGKLPDNLVDLMRLPGIGRYTAGAIASIAFNANVTTLDGNIRRVFARLFDIQVIVNSPQGEKIIWELLEKELPKGKAGDFNQALMDLGATICTPQNPDCEHCPLLKLCLARSNGVQTERPILKTKPVQPQFNYLGAIIQKEDKFLLAQRPSHGLLGGLWEFPNFRIVSDEGNLEKNLACLLFNRFGIEVQILNKQVIIKHAYTHFRLILHVYNCEWIADITSVPEIFYWVPRNKLPKYPMGKVARQISRILLPNEE
jgi:A/G-specific adenine glycosylase